MLAANLHFMTSTITEFLGLTFPQGTDEVSSLDQTPLQRQAEVEWRQQNAPHEQLNGRECASVQGSTPVSAETADLVPAHRRSLVVEHKTIVNPFAPWPTSPLHSNPCEGVQSGSGESFFTNTRHESLHFPPNFNADLLGGTVQVRSVVTCVPT